MKKSWLFIIISLFLAGCGSAKLTTEQLIQQQVQQQLTSIMRQNGALPEAVLSIEVQATSTINPNINGTPSPVDLRIYQLTESGAFEQADFLFIYTDEQVALQAALVSSSHLQSAIPSQNFETSIALNKEAQFIGVIAGFSNYQDARTKAIFPINEYRDTKLNIYLDSLSLTLSGEGNASSQRLPIISDEVLSNLTLENANNGQ